MLGVAASQLAAGKPQQVASLTEVAPKPGNVFDRSASRSLRHVGIAAAPMIAT